MGLLTGTICSKHDKIKELATELSNYADDVKREIERMSENIYDLAEKCLVDGQRMECGLDKKGRKIDDLEDKIKDLEEENEELKERIKELEEELQEK